MEVGSLTSLGGLVITTVASLFGIFRYMSAQTENLRREIATTNETARLLIEKASEAEAKQRHALANTISTEAAKQEMQLRDLQRTTVRHEQMDAVEVRLNASLNKIEGKVDRMGEQLTEIISLRTKLDSVLGTLTRISDRLDEDNGVRKNTRVQ